MIYTLGIFAPIRSGTTFMLHTLRHCNVAVGHGKLECEGAVLWDWTRRVNPTRFRNAWHQTRDPLKTIASIAASAKMFWHRMGATIPGLDLCDSPVLKAMVYWAWWSVECESRTHWRYRVEDVRDGSETWLEICDRLGLEDMLFPAVATGLNGKPHDELTWSDLAAADEPLAARIAEMDERYGYDPGPRAP